MKPTPVRPAWRYRSLVQLLRPVLWAWVAVVAIRIARSRAGEGVPGGARPALDFVAQRLGYRHDATPDAPPLRWLHAASVGEVLTALPLLQALAARGQHLLVTTATPSGAAVLARRAPPGVRHRFLPIDTPGAVARFLDRLRPASGWVVETELWPTLFAAASERGIPLAIVSARLSARTASGPARWLQPAYERALHGVQVLARSDADAARFLALGAAPERVRVLGDLKRAWYDTTGALVAEPAPATRPPPLSGPRPYALAASTHEGEEASLTDAWLALPGNGLLVIVPRHPDRAEAIERQLLQRRPELTRVPRHARRDPLAAHERILLGDTFGELDRWYRSAAAAFIGGSLVPRGGHNLLEAARHALPIATGPHTDNFSDIVAELLAADALQVVSSAAEAACWLSARVHATPAGVEARRAGVGANAGRRALAVAQRDAHLLSRYLDALLRRREQRRTADAPPPST